MKFDGPKITKDCVDLPSKEGLSNFKLFPIDEQ